MAGVPKGREYCQEYFEHEDSWGKEQLYDCFKKHNVDFDKEYCDDMFPLGSDLLM